MKNLKKLLTALVFVSLIIFASCNKKEKEKDDPAGDQAKLLVGKAWTLSAEGAINKSSAQSDWNGFTLTFTGDGKGGSYSTTGSPSDTDMVWPATGTWTFDSATNIGLVKRSDEVDVTLSTITATALILKFSIPDQTATRASAIAGAWTFNFTR